MSEYTRIDSNIERKPLADLANELAVDVEALEERLEMMLALEAATCCVINGGACSAK